MAERHGVYTTEKETSVITPKVADVGVPFAVRVAPLQTAEKSAKPGTPVLCTSYEEAVEQLGWSDDWVKYPVCEVIYFYFKVIGCQPVIINPLDEEATEADAAVGIDAIDLCMPLFNIVPDLILAPGYSNNSAVAAAMATKAEAVNEMFRAKAIVDIDGDAYTDAVTNKNAGSFDKDHIVCWPYAKIGEKVFHMSTVIAGRISQTDSDNGGIPYESPSNKAISVDSICSASGDTIIQTKAHADMLEKAGITTALNFVGSFVAWGNYTGCYPKSTDVKDYFISISRMFGFVNNSIVKTYWTHIDKPMTRRRIDTILDSVNIWLNGLVSKDYLLGARCEVIDSENSLTDLMAGKIKMHIYMTPPSPMQELEFDLEYDAGYVETALAG